MADSRLLPVPDGLAGLRLDVALARLFGMSRTVAAELIDTGQVAVDGVLPARSVKLRGGEWLEITLPDPDSGAPAEPIAVDGLHVLHDDDDVVVVDKPVGVAAHPSPGWTGPTVVQGLAAMGYRIASSSETA